MVVGTYRPLDVIMSEHPLSVLKQDLLVHHLCREIALEPLREAEVAEYLAAEIIWSAGWLGQPDLPALGGNPLFMVTALDDMAARGLISRNKGCWQLGVAVKEIDLQVPKSLQEIIEVQIERLSLEEKRGTGGS
jgi:predicted ATPase